MTKTLQDKIDLLNFDLSYANVPIQCKIWVQEQTNKAIQELREEINIIIEKWIAHRDSIFEDFDYDNATITAYKHVLALIGEKK